MSKTRKVLSLFSGCGGMDLGFEGDFEVIRSLINEKVNKDWTLESIHKDRVRLQKTLFKTVFANDINPHAQTAWVEYFLQRGVSPETFHIGSIVDYVKEANQGNSVFPKQVDVVTGGFPCQDFSVAGKRKGFNSHKSHTGKVIDSYNVPNLENRGQLYIWMKEVIELTQPKMFIAENVKGLVNLSNVKDVITHDFKTIGGDGYLVIPPKVVNAANYGVPQNRERVIFIGLHRPSLKKEALEALSKENLPSEYDPYPVPTHHSRSGSINHFTDAINTDEYVKSSSVLFDLLEPNVSNDPSQKAYSKAKYYGSHVQGQIEIDLDGLAPTIRAEHHGNIEFRRLSEEHGGRYLDELKNGKTERRLTVRECARLQTFPDDFRFVIPPDANINKRNLSASQAYKLIGNAVPPLLAYHLAQRLQDMWDIYF